MPEEKTPQRRRDESERSFARWDKRIRDALLFSVGLAGVINELWIQPEPRIYSLVFLGSILGIPFVLHADEKRRGGDDD